MDLSPDQALELYKEMVAIRKFELALDFLFTRGKIHGTAHLSIGQEAVCVGVGAALRQDDFMTSTHRGHGHAIAKKLSMNKLMAELQGKETGFCSGRGGTQHVVCMEKSFIANGIAGGASVTGTGIALAYQLKNKDNVVVSFFGDGAVNEGHLHETINLAAVWKLPIIYVCENNLYAMSTHTKEAMVIQDISERAKLYGITTYSIDGNEVETVLATMKEAVTLAKEGKGPIFIECKTYRQGGHSKNDARLYRTKEEEGEWKQKDPIEQYEDILKKKYGWTKEKIELAALEAEKEVNKAIQYAEESNFPNKSTVYDHQWAEGAEKNE